MSNSFDSYLVQISADAPSGADLEYDPEFARMEKAAQGTPDQEFGSTRIEGTPADWETVRDAAMGMLPRTHDLRVAVYLAQAELMLDGLVGFHHALQLIAGYVETFWDTVFPLLDEDDDNDPTSRINALSTLSRPGNVLRQLRDTAILRSRAAGSMTWQNVMIARGELPPPDNVDDPPNQRQLDARVRACTLDELQIMYSATEGCISCVDRIDKAFVDRQGYSASPNLGDLSKNLKSIQKLQKIWLDAARPAEGAQPTESGAGSEDRGLISVSPVEMHAGVQTSSAMIYGAASFNIGRREDAIEGLDKIIDWFERFEPSSPLPMLLRRAKRLSHMSFMEILQDISPGGLEQAILVGGKEIEEPKRSASDSSSASSASSSRSAPVPRNDDY